MPALQQFFEAERLRRGWTMRQIAPRAKISLSKAYAIANGDDNVEFETFENIATAFDMTPAELATAIGKGRPEDDPKRAPIHGLVRQIADEDVGMVDRLIRSFVSQTDAMTHQRTRHMTGRKNSMKRSTGDQSGSDKPQGVWNAWAGPILAGMSA